MDTFLIYFVLPLALTFIALFYFVWRGQINRRDFVKNYRWPPGLISKLTHHHPDLTAAQINTVGDGLRQFFLAYQAANYRSIAMPSQVADDLWHEFILYTRDYKNFCDRAFGRFLHHTPAVVLKRDAKERNADLRRTWWQCCKLEAINPATPGRLPLLFALDAQLKIPNGYCYEAECRGVRRAEGSSSTANCGGDFSSTGYDGGTDGMSDGGGDGGSDGGGDGGGCGGD